MGRTVGHFAPSAATPTRISTQSGIRSYITTIPTTATIPCSTCILHGIHCHFYSGKCSGEPAAGASITRVDTERSVPISGTNLELYASLGVFVTSVGHLLDITSGLSQAVLQRIPEEVPSNRGWGHARGRLLPSCQQEQRSDEQQWKCYFQSRTSGSPSNSSQ